MVTKQPLAFNSVGVPQEPLRSLPGPWRLRARMHVSAG